MKKKIIIPVIIVLIFLILLVGCNKSDSTNKDDFQRFAFIETHHNLGTDWAICYDKFSNVMYFYSRRGGFSPIYNADGSFYLYYTQPTVG